jgi:3-hydroxyisobutyrate dehydrogenase
MVGGDAVALGRARAALACYGKTITHCGEPGAGQFTKLVNQVLVSITLVGVSEALAFAGKAGLDLPTTLAATGGGAAASWQLANLGPKIAAGDYAPGFMIDLLLKDLRILDDCARELGVSMGVMAKVHDLFRAAASAGHGRDGTQAVFEAVRASGHRPKGAIGG